MNTRLTLAIGAALIAHGCSDAGSPGDQSEPRLRDGEVGSDVDGGMSDPLRDSGPLDAAELDAPTSDGSTGDGSVSEGGAADGLYPGPCTVVIDEEPFGSPDGTTTYDYSGELLQSWTQDDDNDGQPDRTVNIRYDEGKELRREDDRGADGTLDALTLYFYRANGDLDYVDHDTDADGAYDRRVVYLYDSSGLWTGFEDEDPDGNVVATVAFLYDAMGQLMAIESDYDLDGIADSVEDFVRNESGLVVQRLLDNDGDGTPNSSRSFEHDAAGNPTTESSDFDGDGVTDQVSTFEYDCWL